MFLSYIFAILVPKGRKLCYNISDYVKKEATPMKYRKTARPIALALAAMLVIPPVSASAIIFADISQVPWPGAEVSIIKAAELKLVVGETINGKNYFKPKDPVSLTQTCQLAYKLLLETGKATADSSVQEKWSTVMNTYKIQSWAHPAVSFCLEEGIISISDLSGFVSGEVNRSATREQAAEILGRALEVGVPSKTANATSTIFKDNASISKDAIPYIALLNAEKIVNGDDVGKFNPKSTLNRTETAVMVTNLYEVLKGAATTVKPSSLGTQSGTVKDMNSLYVNFENSNAYFLYASTGATITLNDESATVSEIVELFKDGNEIKATLTLDSNNRITKMAATCEDAEAESKEKLTEGELTKMTYDDEDEDGTITIDGKTTYRIDDVYSVDIFVTSKDEEDEEYDYDDFYDLYQDAKKDKSTITVELKFKKDEVDVIEATIKESKNAKKDLKGDVVGDITKLKYNSDDEGEIKIKGKTYEIEDVYDIDIEIDGDEADWDELYEWYEEYEEDDETLYGAVNLDSDDYVEEILVLTKTSTVQGKEEEGEVDEVTFDEDDEEGTITVDGDEYEAPETDYVDIDIEDGNTTIDSWKELYQAYEDGKTLEVTLDVDGDEVLEITGKVTKAKGRLNTFGDDYLTLKGKKSKVNVKYEFEVSDEDDEDEYEEETQEMLEDISVDIDGLSYVENLYEFMEWLEEAKADKDLYLTGDDDFTLEFELDKDGYITEITGEYDH